MPGWKVLSERIMPVGHNPLGNLFYGYRRTGIQLPDGQLTEYHGILVKDCVHVVAVEDDLTTYLVRQIRPNIRRPRQPGPIPHTLELPGGFADHSPDLAICANYELAGEIGRMASSLEKLGEVYPSTGVSNERDTIFLGRELVIAEPAGPLEATEQDVRVVSDRFGKLYDMLRSGQEPVSAQTLAGFALAAAVL